MITLNTVAELTAFLNKTELGTLVGEVAFAGSLLAQVLGNGSNQICINEDIGFMDDGGWIKVNENGVVVGDAWLP